MCTFKIYVNPYKRLDGKYHVEIRVGWKRKRAAIPTAYYVTDKQITTTGELRANYILKDLTDQIALYEDLKAKKLGQRINLYTAKELAEFFKAHTGTQNTEVDFIAEANEVIVKIDNPGNAGIYRTVLNSIKLFTNSESLPVNYISQGFLDDYVSWLFHKKKDGKPDGVGPSGANLYLRTFRAMFNRIRKKQNKKDKGEINMPFNPFEDYPLPEIGQTEKQALPIDVIKSIRDCQPKEKRGQLARDVFMLSFYLIGMNTADLYEYNGAYKDRITYCRKKTQGRRKDKARISIKIPPEAADLIKKYLDHDHKRTFYFYKRYANTRSFDKAVNKGLKLIGATDAIKVPDLKFYAARHSWATIARNDCSISKYDIREALNHSDPGMKVTDIYLKKDWSIIDNANRKVLDLLIGSE